MQILTCPFCEIQLLQYNVCGYTVHPANGCQLENTEILSMLNFNNIKNPAYQYTLVKLLLQAKQFIKNFFQLLGDSSIFNNAYLKLNFDESVLLIKSNAQSHTIQEATTSSNFRLYRKCQEYKHVDMEKIATGNFDQEYFDILKPMLIKLEMQTHRAIWNPYHPCCSSCSHGNDPCTERCNSYQLAIMV